MSNNSTSNKSPSSTINLSEVVSSLMLSSRDPATWSPQELMAAVEDITTVTLHLSLENEVIENFLHRTDPSLLADVDEEMKKLEIKERRSKKRHSHTQPVSSTSTLSLFANKWKKGTEDRLSIYRGSKTTNRSVTTIASGLPLPSHSNDVPPKANIRLRFELVDKETEERLKSAERLRRTKVAKQALLDAKHEQLEMSLRDVRGERDAFERNVIATGAENITHRISGEKFVAFVENSLRKSSIELCLLRLKTSHLRAHHVTVERTLKQRTELATSVGILDMTILKRDYEINNETLLFKTAEMKKMKRAAGPRDRSTNCVKEAVMRDVTTLKDVEDQIAKKHAAIEVLQKGTAKTTVEIEELREKIRRLQKHRREHVPVDAMGYLHVKLEIESLKKEIKIWTRRRKVQKANIGFSKRHLKVLDKHSVYSEFK